MPKRVVTVIEPTIDPITRISYTSTRKRRVAGYARVSTDHDEQFTSYEAQIDYYTRYIKSNPDWQFVAVYTDEGISGLNTKNRDGFKRMINDALDGKIDLIVTKSVSRFARNTVDSLTTIRALKDAGVECYFEKENIYTFDGKGELLLTIMSSIAQEESRSISENVTWAARKRFADGRVVVAYNRFLGYKKGPDKEHPLVIVEEEAAIVRRIYHEFISGKTPWFIAKQLTEDGVKTPGNKTKWLSETVESILRNEKYKGSALLQKTFTEDFLSKKHKKNTGEIPQYYVENSHEAIIPPEEWEAVQQEIARRKRAKKFCGKNVLELQLICGDCGAFYGPKVWNSTDKYRRVVWQCNNKYKKGKEVCRTPHLNEDDIKRRFIDAFNQINIDRKQVIEDLESVLLELTDTTEIDSMQKTLIREMDRNVACQRKLIEDNSSIEMDQETYDQNISKLQDEYSDLKGRTEDLQKQKLERIEKGKAIRNFIQELEQRPKLLTEFDDYLWYCTLDYVTVRRDKKLVFHFKNGMDVEA